LAAAWLADPATARFRSTERANVNTGHSLRSRLGALLTALFMTVALSVATTLQSATPASAADRCQHGSHNHLHVVHLDYWHYHRQYNLAGVHYHVYHNHRHYQTEHKLCGYH
jgi:hypothetical protein